MEMGDINGKHLLHSCASLVKLPAHIIDARIDFCKSLITIRTTQLTLMKLNQMTPDV
jgi:hypothetical protein